MAFKIFRKNCCGLDVHKTWVYACVGITDTHERTEEKQACFSSFSKGLRNLADWLAKYSCIEVCRESAGKYWIPVFSVLEKICLVTLAHPKYMKPQKGNKTDRKDAKWICDLFICDMINSSFIPSPEIRQLRDLVRYLSKLTDKKNHAQNCLTVSNLKLDNVFSDVWGNLHVPLHNTSSITPVNPLMSPPSWTSAAKRPSMKYRLPLTARFPRTDCQAAPMSRTYRRARSSPQGD